MKVIIIILIGVTILFAILGVFNISMKENMTDVPTMPNDEPQCFPNTVVDYASFNEKENDERYILKTKIVPPKGTACPTEISAPASKYLKGKDETTINASESVNSTTSTSISNTSNLTQNITENTPSPSESTENNSNNQNNSKNSNNLNNSNKPNDTNNLNNSNKPNDMISNNTCPPCPACERCPEPAFDCKKVPNYSSPAIGQYLPMPILNDFSKF